MGVTTQHIVQGYNSELHIPGSILTEMMAESSVQLVAITWQLYNPTSLTKMTGTWKLSRFAHLLPFVSALAMKSG